MAKAKTVGAKKANDERLKSAQRAALLLKQVSDATRIQVIQMLAPGEVNVGDMCELLQMSQPAVSHHLALLRHGGIVSTRRQGKHNLYSLTPVGEALAGVIGTIQR